MSTDLVVGLLGGGGLGAIILAIITGLFSKKKLGAEATEIITKAAAGVVTSLQAELDRQVIARETQTLEHRQDMVDLMAAHDREIEEVRRVLQLHVAWDLMAIAKLQDLGVTMPPAPPLLPPLRAERPDLPPLPSEV